MAITFASRAVIWRAQRTPDELVQHVLAVPVLARFIGWLFLFAPGREAVLLTQTVAVLITGLPLEVWP